MEQGVVVEENHQKSDCAPVLKSSGSLIRIDSIYIDLASAMDNHQDAVQCDHFSIRGYVAGMRKKDMSVCLPFPSDSNRNDLEEQTNVLPPLHVAKFRCWGCHNCHQEISTTRAEKETAKDSDCFQSGYMVCKGSSSCLEHLNDAAEGVRPTASTKVNEDEILLPSCDYDKEKNDEVGHPTAVGSEREYARNDSYQKICSPINGVISSKLSLIPERRGDGPDAIGLKSSDMVEFYGPSCKGNSGSNIRNLEYSGSSSTEIGQMGTLNSAEVERRLVSLDSEIPKVDGRSNEEVVKTSIPSLDLEEHDNLSSESGDILGKYGHRDPLVYNSSGLVRQRTQKVRLLTELLGSGGNAEIDQGRRGDGPSTISKLASGLDSVSEFCSQMTVQTSLKQNIVNHKGKRKISQDENEKAVLTIIPTKVPKKSRLSRGDAEITIKNCGIPGSETEDSSGKRPQHRTHKNPVLSKKKHNQTQIEGGYPILMSREDVIPKKIQLNIGSPKKYIAATDSGFPNPVHPTSIKNGMELHYTSSLSSQQAERKSNMCKKKSKQVGQTLPHWNSVLGENLISRKDLSIVETEPDGVKLKSTHDAFARTGVDLSLNSHGVTLRNEASRITKAREGVNPFLPQWKSSLREDYHQRKDILHIGESSDVRKSAPDIFFGKGLLYDLNEKVVTQHSLSDTQNAGPLVEKRSFHQSDTSGICISETTDNGLEQGNDDIPMEIVELMAKNQYERFRHEGERNSFLSKQANDKRNAELMSFPRAYGNGVLKSFNVDSQRMRIPLSESAMVKSGENLTPIKQNPFDFPESNGNRFNMGKLEGRSEFSENDSFLYGQDMQSGRIRVSTSGCIRNGNSQIFQWKGDNFESSFSPTKVRYPLIPNNTPFGHSISIPQNYVTQTSDFGMKPRLPESSGEGKAVRDFDLNFVNKRQYHIEKQNRNFGLESSRNASTKESFASKHRGIDLNAKVPGSLDIHSNETIPAMQLLSLMDAKMQSSSPFGKPFSPCDHHPKVGLDTPLKVLEKPLFLSDHHLSGPSSSAFYGKNHFGEKSCECSPPIPAFASYPSPFKKYGNIRGGTGTTSRAPSKSEERRKGPTQNRGRKSQKSLSTTGVLQNRHNPTLIRYNQRESSYPSNGMVLPLQHHTVDSIRCTGQDTRYMNGTVFPLANISNNDFCSVNRNPADFSIPEPGNIYMINGRDLKFGKKISSKCRNGLVNVDGQKRQRVTKFTVTAEF